MKITEEMISAAVNAPTLGDNGSYVFDYIDSPEHGDPDWKVVGGEGPYQDDEWTRHIVQRIIEAALENAGVLEK